MRRTCLLASAALILAACSSGDGSTIEIAEAATTVTAPATEAPTTTAPPATEPPPVETEAPTPTTPAPTTTVGQDCPAVGGLPSLLVSQGRTVSVLEDGRLTRLVDLPTLAGVALADGTGGAVVQRMEPIDEGQFAPAELLRVGPDGRATVLDVQRDITVYDTGALGGGFAVLYGVYPAGGLEDGDLVLQPLDGGAPTKLGSAYGPEFGIQSAKIADSMITASAGADLSEVVLYLDDMGTRIEGRFSPTDALAYNMPPYISNAVPSPDGSSMVWLEGPDWNGEIEDFVPAPTYLVLADSASGAEITRFELTQLSDNGQPVAYLDYDGRYAIVSQQAPGDPTTLVLAVDLSTEPPTATELCVSGIATVNRIFTG